jgi:hypothetical protein
VHTRRPLVRATPQAPAAVRRAADAAPPASPPSGPPTPPAVPPVETPPPETPAPAQPPVDVAAVAERVYDLIRDRLARERERKGR